MKSLDSIYSFILQPEANVQFRKMIESYLFIYLFIYRYESSLQLVLADWVRKDPEEK
jgi:hypothetical protein